MSNNQHPNQKHFDPVDYSPQRFGLSYNPPQIVVEYLIPSSGKLYHHKIKLHKFSSEMKISEVIEEIYKKHQNYLMHQRVSKAQIIQLVEKLKEKYPLSEEYEKMIESSALNKKRESDDKYTIDQDEDMNKLSKEELDLKKKEMDKFYEKHHIQVGDKEFQYDVRKDFNNDQYDPEWDDEF